MAGRTDLVIGVQVVGLHEPHQMHRVDIAGEPAVGLMDVIADRLGACDAFFADLDRTVAMLGVRDQLRHGSLLLRGFGQR
jgi:hypothetical protein